MKKAKPKYKRGQVVCIVAYEGKPYEVIRSVNEDAPSYNTDSGIFSEYELRALTPREIGKA